MAFAAELVTSETPAGFKKCFPQWTIPINYGLYSIVSLCSALFSVDVSIAQRHLFSDGIISSHIKTRMQGNVHSEVLESIADISHQSTANLSFRTKCYR